MIKVEAKDTATNLNTVAYPAFPNSAMFTPSQLLMASQLMAASGLGIPTNPAFFHAGLFPPAWTASSPPSPPNSEQLSPALKARKHNNNNNVVSSSSGVDSKPTKRKCAKKLEEEVPLPSPTSSSSPPSSTGTDIAKYGGGRDKQFTCGVCNRSFGYKHVLQNHERTHTGEKPFECPECHKRFTRDHHLKTHMRLHTGERPYHCDVCDRKFVQVANLRRHLRVHTGERPYTCEHCTAMFADSNQLKAHLLIHTNEKPFSCERCHSKFRRRHHLLHHKCGMPEKTISPEVPESAEDETRIRRSRPPSSPLVTLPLHVALPEQTEPEDLSMTTGLHSHSSGDSPMSRSPCSRGESDEEAYESDDSTVFFLHRKSTKSQT